ncbi:MAG TPA: hypothetical protein VIC51_13450, partial [Psychromonas sp.]
PEYYSGLLGQEATDKLRKRATGTGIANALLALVAQPRNQGYGSALPYIGKALMAGQQAGQNVIQGGLREFDVQQRLAEMKRQQEQREAQRQFASNLPPNIRDAATAYPEIASKYAENMVMPKQRETFVAPDGSIRFKDTGEVARQENVLAPQGFKTIEVQEGRNKVTYQVNPDGTRTKIATGAMDAPQKGTSPSYKTETDASGNLVYIPNVPGLPVLDQRGLPTTYTPKATEPKVTDAQNLAAGFYDRMKSASEIIDSLDASASRPEKLAESLRAIPFVGDVAARSTESPARQQYRQAQANWVRANLRKESGAVIGEQEMADEIATYFPQIGDSASVIEQKRLARQVTEEAMKRNAGGALNETTTNNSTNNFNLNNIAIEPRVSQKPRLKYNMATGRFE